MLEDAKTLRRIEAFRRSNQADFAMPSGGLSPRVDRFTMFVDMAGLDGRLSTSAIFDMVERARTNIVGGQGKISRCVNSEYLGLSHECMCSKSWIPYSAISIVCLLKKL